MAEAPHIAHHDQSSNGHQNARSSIEKEELEALPGTRRLFDSEGHVTKHGDVVLIPQPTDSPNDPLQWSLARKIWHTALVCFVTALTAATSNSAGSAADGFNEELGIDYSSFNTGAGILFIGIGYWVLFSSPAVHLYGRRILYLVSMILGLAGSIWFGVAKNEAGTIWSQLFVGASESIAEAVVQLSLMDLWFEHQAGAAIGVYVLATSVGTYLGSLIASYIAYSFLGFRWVGYMGAVICGGTLVLLFFGLEETQFDRAGYMAKHGLNVSERVEKVVVDAALDDEKKGGQSPTRDFERSGSGFAEPEAQKSYWQRIQLISPAHNLRGSGFKQWTRQIWHTLKVFTFPAVWYAGLQWGMQSAMLTFYLTVEQDTWYGAPWFYSDAQVGNMNIPTLIGSVIGCCIAGWGSDYFTLWVTRRRGGVMEAESRLWLMILPTIIFPAGMFIFGIGSGRGWDWPAPYVGLGFIGFGYGCAGDLSMAYLVDAYPDMVLEGMVGVAVINNSIGCIFSFVTSPWMDASGVENTFIAAGVLSFAALATTLPMAVWGKAARRATKKRYDRFVAERDGLQS
ncbi:MFS general substrate transporter [Schizophyllum commune Loenen D]|nr:MFS general substrate transporter [Schizophyllum commune Loenen D]